MIALGKLMRQDPLPPGVYWIDVVGTPAQESFGAWAFENQKRVTIITSESFEAVNWPDCPVSEGECSPPRDWVKFKVNEATHWDAVKLGYPNVIGVDEHIESSGDTASVPDFSDNCDIGCQATKVAIAGGVLLGGIALIMILKR